MSRRRGERLYEGPLCFSCDVFYVPSPVVSHCRWQAEEQRAAKHAATEEAADVD